MNLSQLEVLVAIVETGSLSEAAEVVGLTQSAVSYSLSKLEAELGVSLLERGRQGVALTRVGEEVLQHARHILAQIEIIRQKTARERGLAIGKLRFGCVPTIPARLLTGVMRDFQHRYPEIEQVVFEGTPQELIDWLARGIIDIGTVLEPAGYALGKPFAHTELCVITANAHPFARQKHVSITGMADETLIGPRAEYGILRSAVVFSEIVLPRARHEVSTRGTIVAMVRENMGISIIPQMLIEETLEGISILPFDPPQFMDVYLAAQAASPAAEAFLQCAHAWSRTHGFLP